MVADPTSNPMIFNIGKWHARLIYTPAAFNSLVDMAEHPKAATEYKLSMGLKSFTADGQVAWIDTGEHVESLRNAVYDDALSAVDHYASLMVVTAATYIENILLEFLASYFKSKPNSIHAHLMPDASKKEEAFVPLREVLAASDIESLHSALAHRAANNAANGAISKVFVRIKKLTGYQFSSSVESDLSVIISLRNAIVHDGESLTKKRAAVANRFESVHAF